MPSRPHMSMSALALRLTRLNQDSTHLFDGLQQFDIFLDLQGSKPLVFMCQHRGSGVRVVYTAMPEGAKAGDLKQGIKLKPDRKAAIIGLVAHPTSKFRTNALIVHLFDDAREGRVRRTWPALLEMNVLIVL